MVYKSMFRVYLLTLVISCVPGIAKDYYAGTWDSTIYNRAERPRTVGVRLEIVDSDTHIPVQEARVFLRGWYLEEWVGRSGDQVGTPLEPQEKEFEIGAESNRRGVAVFALGWQKEYPWLSYFGNHPPSHGVGKSWIRAVDDVEKVQRIEIRHPGYRYLEIPFSFRHLLEFGQNKKSSMQQPRLFDEFEEAWIREIKRRNVKFCILNLSINFKDFENKKSRRPEFFEKIVRENWGTVYQKPYNYFSRGEYPQSECGPYFIYEIMIPLEKRSGQIDVSIPSQEKEKKAKKAETGKKRKEEDAKKAEKEKKRKEQQAKKEAEQGKERKDETENDKTEFRPDKFGLAVIRIGDADRKKLGIPGHLRAVGINYVESGSYADKAGLKAGQIINQLMLKGKNGVFAKKWSIMDMDDYRTYLLKRAESGNVFYLEIYQKHSSGKWISDKIKVEIE